MSQDQLRNRIAAALPSGTEAITGTQLADEQASDIQEGLGFLNTFLLVFAAVALFVGAFIIFNTFSILVAQRTRELALMRALGASKGQVTRSVLLEAVVVGLIASAVGLGAGVGVAIGLQALFGAFGAGLPSASPVIELRTVIAAFAVGIVVTAVAALMPARRAAEGAAGGGDAGRGDRGPVAASSRPSPARSCAVGGAVAMTFGADRQRTGGARARHGAGVPRRGAALAAGEPAGDRDRRGCCSGAGCPAGWAGRTRCATRGAPRPPRRR